MPQTALYERPTASHGHFRAGRYEPNRISRAARRPPTLAGPSTSPPRTRAPTGTRAQRTHRRGCRSTAARPCASPRPPALGALPHRARPDHAGGGTLAYAQRAGDVAHGVASRPHGAGGLSLRWHRHRPPQAARARPRGACVRRRPAASGSRARARRIGRRGRCLASRRRPCTRAAPTAAGR